MLQAVLDQCWCQVHRVEDRITEQDPSSGTSRYPSRLQNICWGPHQGQHSEAVRYQVKRQRESWSTNQSQEHFSSIVQNWEVKKKYKQKAVSWVQKKGWVHKETEAQRQVKRQAGSYTEAESDQVPDKQKNWRPLSNFLFCSASVYIVCWAPIPVPSMHVIFNTRTYMLMQYLMHWAISRSMHNHKPRTPPVPIQINKN